MYAQTYILSGNDIYYICLDEEGFVQDFLCETSISQHTTLWRFRMSKDIPVINHLRFFNSTF